ncbi:MAG: hypothetical protein MAG453_01053 [Calditrichaeota bacterium]|nr:hypothetical protein [Calditrichota bacterium]
MHTRLPVTILLLAALIPAARAQFDWGAKYAGDYISGQSNARLLALGGAGVAIADGPSAVLANPARIRVEHAHAVSLMHADRFESAVKVDHAAYVRRSAGGDALGFGLVRQGVDDIPVTRLRDPRRDLGVDNRVIRVGSTSASEYAFLLSYAGERSFGRVGASAKLLYKRLDDADGYGLGIDAGYARTFLDRLHVGAQVRDAIVSVLTWDTGRQEVIYPTVRAGAAYEFAWSRMKSTVMPVAELELRGESIDDPDAFAVHAGLEYRIREIVAARVGYDDGRISYGAGLRVGGVRLDYAFIGHEDLGATHRVSVGVYWGS